MFISVSFSKYSYKYLNWGYKQGYAIYNPSY